MAIDVWHENIPAYRCTSVTTPAMEFYQLKKTTGPFASIYYETFRVTYKTPKGYWVGTRKGHRMKWSGNDNIRKFAHFTKDEALEAFKRRKVRQIQILRSQLIDAELGLEAAEVGRQLGDVVFGVRNGVEL